MFGYVTICEPELKVKDLQKYKAYYCGLCRTLKEKYGSLGQMTLTYDMTFAIILLNSLYEGQMRASDHRCKTHPLKKRRMLQNEITEYAADMNLILAYYHMKDNWEDEKKISGLFGVHTLHKKAAEAMKKYPRQGRAIRRELKALLNCEKKGVMEIDEPAGCFGRLMEELFLYKKDVWEKPLREMGFFLGKFIYIMDAYEDLEKDKKDGNYNPLKNLAKEADFEEKCRQMLCMMIAECSAAFERLPCLEDADILRNVLYAGVWNRYHKLHADNSKNISVDNSKNMRYDDKKIEVRSDRQGEEYQNE